MTAKTTTGVLGKERSAFRNINATRVIVTAIGVFFGIGGMDHGFFEILQGNTPTPGLVINAIGEAQRFWVEGTEPAFTLVPNFMITGILAMIVGLTIVIWSLFFVHKKHGRAVFLGLFILLFLVGGGMGQAFFFIPAWAFATRMHKPLTWWKKVLPRSSWPFLSNLWVVTLTLVILLMLFVLEIAIFGIIPGMTDPAQIQDTSMYLFFSAIILNIVTFIAGFGHELLRMEQG
jgi:hypothetical protein